MPKPAPPRESVIQKSICNWLDANAILWWRMPIGGVMHGGIRKRSPLKGFPDIAGLLLFGKLFLIECKREGEGRFSPEQLEWRSRLTANGAFYIEARCLEDVTVAFDKYLRGVA